jgi:hypothetical protein
MWQALPGRDLVVDIDRAAGLYNLWRPLTLTPQAAENAFFSVFVPLGAFLLAVQLDLDDRRRLVVPLIIIGGLAASWAFSRSSETQFALSVSDY